MTDNIDRIIKQGLKGEKQGDASHIYTAMYRASVAAISAIRNKGE